MCSSLVQQSHSAYIRGCSCTYCCALFIYSSLIATHMIAELVSKSGNRSQSLIMCVCIVSYIHDCMAEHYFTHHLVDVKQFMLRCIYQFLLWCAYTIAKQSVDEHIYEACLLVFCFRVISFPVKTSRFVGLSTIFC